jgi:putative ABC transport system permease protein
MRAVLSQGMRAPVIGIVIGLFAALALARVMTSLLFEVGATDPATLASVALLLASVAMVACYVAGRRATRVEPVLALRAG